MLSIWKILLIVLVLVLLFGGRGKISSVMGDMARGIKSFKTGLKDEDDEAAQASSIPDRGQTIDATATREKSEV
jgi:sec-independent protein translocase protein TatA